MLAEPIFSIFVTEVFQPHAGELQGVEHTSFFARSGPPHCTIVLVGFTVSVGPHDLQRLLQEDWYIVPHGLAAQDGSKLSQPVPDHGRGSEHRGWPPPLLSGRPPI